MPSGQLSNIPWRRTGVKYTNNEAYFDVIEEVDAIIDKSGATVFAEIQGYVCIFIYISYRKIYRPINQYDLFILSILLMIPLGFCIIMIIQLIFVDCSITTYYNKQEHNKLGHIKNIVKQ